MDIQQLLESYCGDVQFPGVSGIEHHHMLQVRDELHTLAPEMTAQEVERLELADRQLIASASDFVVELARFIDLSEERERQSIGPKRWWWFLDVLASLPQ